ncbi:hypothetical protein N9D48_02140 [Gammaproteobacteria bacterium]|nr:hypothetical protein [Gammaproteobacteria bacterium]
MKKLSVLLFLVSLSTSLQAEISYNPNNPEHKLDNYCVGVVSFARDLFYNDVEIIDGKVWMYSVEPTADVQKVRIALTDLSNKLILKYEYSKQFNTHYRTQAILVKQKAIEQGGEYLKKELEMCKERV